jgi:hypothetical protein
MKKRGNTEIGPWLTWLRVCVLLLTGLIGLCWISSYFVGIQRYQSEWSTSHTATSEEARWLVSNHGSIGLAWRSQAGEPGFSTPADEFELKAFDSSPSSLNNVHPEGFFSWHWIHYEPTKSKMMGSMRTGYGHLYIPYWMPFLTSGLLAFLVSVCIKRRANKRLEINQRPAPELKIDGDSRIIVGTHSRSQVAGDSA